MAVGPGLARRATHSHPLFSLWTGRTCSFPPAAAVTFAVAFAPLSLVTGYPATVLFPIFFLLAVADAVVTWIAVTAAKFLLRLSSSLFHVAAPLRWGTDQRSLSIMTPACISSGSEEGGSRKVLCEQGT